MLRRSTGVSLDTKRVAVSIGSDIRDGVVKVSLVALERSTSEPSSSVEVIALPDAKDCRRSSNGSISVVAMASNTNPSYFDARIREFIHFYSELAVIMIKVEVGMTRGFGC